MQDRSPSLHGVASQVDSLLRQYDALDYFRDRVREAAQEHIEAVKECEHCVKRRRDAVAKDGVLSLPLDDEVVKEKTNEGYFFWTEEFRGRIKLPPDVTEPVMLLTDRPQFPNRPAFPNPPLKPRCLSCRIPRDNWSEEDERKAEEFNKKLAEWENAVNEYHKKRADWERERLAYMASPKRDDVQVPSKWEEDWRPIFELAKTRNFPDDGDGGFPYTFTVEAWLPGDLHSDRNLPTDPLPVPETEKELSPNFKYAGLAAIYDAHWGGSERIAPWGVVKSGGKVSPASGLPSEWKTPEEPGSYRAASWYWRLVISAKELDDRNTTIVDSWVADVKSDLRENGPKKALVNDLPDELQELINDLPPDASVRVAYRRDHLWLKWKDQLSEKARCNVEIRDRWNGLSDAHRKIISPRLADMIGTERSGAETVRLGISKAGKELKEEKPKSVHRNAKKSRSRKKK